MIEANFRADWKEFLEREFPSYDLRYDPSESLEENTVRYFNARRRIPGNAAWTIHESKELCIPKEHSSDYCCLKRILSEGGDLRPYLSHDVRKKRIHKNDLLLNSWGIHHLHFRSTGSRFVLFVKFSGHDVFALQAFSHGRGHPDVWVNTLLLRILHDNWPGVASGKILGVGGECLTASERTTLRTQHVNFATAMPDGTVYLASGGGTVASGRCFVDIRDTAKMFSNLTYWQRLIETNETSLREALNIFLPKKLSIKMGFGSDECWLYEPTRPARLSLTLLQ